MNPVKPINLQVIVLLLLFLFWGCGSHLDAEYGSIHIPPSKPSVAKQKPSGQTKTPATQRPYKIGGVKYTPLASAKGYVQTGYASWYGRKFHGRKTSNGETYNMYAMTAAHKTLPINTWVRVHNLENNRKIVVRINDRGPFVRGRIIDLSYTGAKRIGIVGPGTAKVKVTALGKATSYSKKTQQPVTFQPVNYWEGNFTVQVGAFQDKFNAVKYKYKLAKSYQNAHIVKYKDHRGLFFRVRIGKFTNMKDAENFKDNIWNKGFYSAFIVAE